MMEDASEKIKPDKDFKELGVLFENHSQKNVIQLKAKRFNWKLKIYREFVLATLSALDTERKQRLEKESSSSEFYALDAYSCTGLAAIQWKKYVQDIHVTAADHDEISLIKENAERNSLTCSTWQLDPSRVLGDPKASQAGNEIFSCRADAKSLMTMEAFNFIYLSPYKNGSSCLEPAFQSLASGGVLALVVPDLSIFSRAPHVVRREFSAQIIKTEYLKEMAARVVLAEAARSAAKYSKGISVLYVVSQEDYLLMAVRVYRGQKAVDSTLNNVCQLLHCRFCEERLFLPNQLAPYDDPYGLLTCTCKSENLGKTAVIIGPMWKGCIYKTDFLNSIVNEGNKLKLSAKFVEMASLLVIESMCLSGSEKANSGLAQEDLKSQVNSDGKTSSDSETSENKVTNVDEPTKLPKEITVPSGHPDLVPMTMKEAPRHTENQGCFTHSGKRKVDMAEEKSLSKRQKRNFVEESELQGVPFYYNVSRSKKGIPHKLNNLVKILQENGHRASRTHFDPCGIRTSASVSQFMQILE
ncbi:hypothetical protein EGW08_023528 [Elysia chlorotica]|uniref:tRNA (guanine(26)-N(2))-dimethyltransferase n=1 Tax=Elysia chlorotica TaxID=188477 RepID=A0A3S1AQ12_ELYCH|nr:hypothetical protein EGW08_023528 [Elysia chlorotica]